MTDTPETAPADAAIVPRREVLRDMAAAAATLAVPVALAPAAWTMRMAEPLAQKAKQETVQLIVDDTVAAMKNSQKAEDRNIPEQQVRQIAQTYYEELEKSTNYAIPAAITGGIAAAGAQHLINDKFDATKPSRRAVVRGLATGSLVAAALEGGYVAGSAVDIAQIPALGSSVTATQIEEATGGTVMKLQDSASNTEIQAVVAHFEPIRRERAAEYLKQSYIKQQQEAAAQSGVNGLK